MYSKLHQTESSKINENWTCELKFHNISAECVRFNLYISFLFWFSLIIPMTFPFIFSLALLPLPAAWEVFSPLYQFCVILISRLLPDGHSQKSDKVFWNFIYVKLTWIDPIVELGLCLVRALWVWCVSIASVLEIGKPFHPGTLLNCILIVLCGLRFCTFLVQQQWSSPI